MSNCYWYESESQWRSRLSFGESDSFFPPIGSVHQTNLVKPSLDPRVKAINPFYVILEINAQVPSSAAVMRMRSRLMRSKDLANSALLLDRPFTFTSTSPTIQTWTKTVPFESFKVSVDEFEGFLFENEIISGFLKINGARQTVVYEVLRDL